MKTFTTTIVATATMMAQANSLKLQTDPTDLSDPVYDDLAPEMIDEEGMIIWSMIAEDFERDRMEGFCEFC